MIFIMNWGKIRYVIIIIELAQREYQAKNILLEKIQGTGRNAIILPREYAVAYLKKNQAIAHEILIIEKSAQYYQRKWFSMIKNMGASLIVLEEEGWIPFDWKDFMSRRLPQSSIPFIDEYWCSNRLLYQKVHCRYPDLKIAFTGHPRWNILNKQFQTRTNSFGCDKDVVLLVSTFGMLSSDVDFMKVIQSETGDNFDREMYEKIKLQLKRKFAAWCEFLETVAECRQPKFTARLRLHPAEVNVYDKALLDKYSISTYSLEHDLNESCLVIHPGSTVTFDAEFFGVPSIMLDDDTDILLSADPKHQRTKTRSIFSKLVNGQFKTCSVHVTETVSKFHYEIPALLNPIKVHFRKPQLSLFFIKQKIKLLSFLNFKGYRRLNHKLRELAKIELNT